MNVLFREFIGPTGAPALLVRVGLPTGCVLAGKHEDRPMETVVDVLL